ncbi:MAG TPA: hypothetical protein V6C97_02615 [Oculatellaceae cyanobacterium]
MTKARFAGQTTTMNEKIQSYLQKTFKIVIFTAILGAIVLFAGAKLIEKMFGDIINEATKTSAPPPAPPAK